MWYYCFKHPSPKFLDIFFLFLIFKLGCFIADAFFHMCRTLKLNSESWKTKTNNVWLDWLRSKGQFHQQSTSCFYPSRSWMRKKDWQPYSFFALYGSVHVKAVLRTLVKLTSAADPIKLFSLLMKNLSAFCCKPRSFDYQWFFSIYYKTLKLNNKNWKTEKTKVF